ncbi:Uncharacterised protein [Serratia quinivorans]|uniref:Uncharacterized protein n=1 Tax=Serratia quinivorans TaxID=137545 RepID=A0A380AAH6_9GAMM|nr:Uncharacterised protein [Serratia quinivorans]SUI77130.1 Uncharacterised protein [Serratia quinivorans]
MHYTVYILIAIVLLVNGTLAIHCWRRCRAPASRPEERNYD